jgi:hypothetical protein
MAEYQLKEWRDYYERKPFGPHVTTSMLALVSCSLSGGKVSDAMPRLEKNLAAFSEDELVTVLPGGDEAKMFLESLDGNR